MSMLKDCFSIQKLAFALTFFTLFCTALSRLLPFEWMQTASQWGVLTLLIAFILGCASLLIVGVASVLPREEQSPDFIRPTQNYRIQYITLNAAAGSKVLRARKNVGKKKII